LFDITSRETREDQPISMYAIREGKNLDLEYKEVVPNMNTPADYSNRKVNEKRKPRIYTACQIILFHDTSQA
jgi:hypothetical protein